MSNAPLTTKDYGNAIMLSESIELMAQGLRETYLDHGLKSGDDTAEHSLYAGLNMIAFAAKNLGDYVEQCQNELERAVAPLKPGKGAVMNNLVASSISWANVQVRVQPARPLSPRWAKDRAKALQDIYWRMRLVNLAGVLADGTTWSVEVPTEEKNLPYVDWWNKRWVQFNFSSPVVSNFMVYARCARAYLDDMEKTYRSQINSYNSELKRFGFELAEPGDPGAFLVKVLHRAERPDTNSPQ